MFSFYVRPLPLAGVAMLCACSSSPEPLADAGTQVDSLIQTSASRIALAQNEVTQLHRVTLPAAPASAVSRSPAATGTTPELLLSHAKGNWHNLSILGTQDATYTQLVAGTGRTMPLTTALRSILPMVWTISTGPGVPSEIPVHWQGTDQWPYTLDRLLGRLHLTAVLDATRHHIDVYRADYLPVKTVAQPRNPFSGKP